jgi:DNA-binding winged helix-turn-helix (wHTH) protein
MLRDRKIAPRAAAESGLCFGPFRLEGVKRLWRGERQVYVRPRPLAVLHYLAERPGRLVTGEELLKHLWPGVYVTRTVLRVCVHEIRQALGEGPTAPRFLETVGRQGYRFTGTVNAQPSALSPSLLGTRQSASFLPSAPLAAQAPPQSTSYFVGREPELTRLHVAFARARQGERQVVFVLGEGGDWQDHLGGSLSSTGAGQWTRTRRPRAVSRTAWTGKSLFGTAGGVGAAV